MKRLFAVACILALASTATQAAEPELFHLSSNAIPVENGKVLDMEFHETDRTAESSTVQIVRRSGSSVASSMFVLRGMCGLARSRGAQYFVAVPAEGEKGSRFTVTFPASPGQAKTFSVAQCELLGY